MNADRLLDAREKWESSKGADRVTTLYSVLTEEWGLLALNEYSYETAGSDYRLFRYFEGGGQIQCSIDIDTEDEREAWIALARLLARS